MIEHRWCKRQTVWYRATVEFAGHRLSGCIATDVSQSGIHLLTQGVLLRKGAMVSLALYGAGVAGQPQLARGLVVRSSLQGAGMVFVEDRVETPGGAISRIEAA